MVLRPADEDESSARILFGVRRGFELSAASAVYESDDEYVMWISSNRWSASRW